MTIELCNDLFALLSLTTFDLQTKLIHEIWLFPLNYLADIFTELSKGTNKYKINTDFQINKKIRILVPDYFLK
jgi:hypothetical protein